MTAMRSRDATVGLGELETAYSHLRHSHLLSLHHYCLRFEIMVGQMMLSLFSKRLANVTRRRVSHRAVTFTCLNDTVLCFCNKRLQN